MRRIILPHGGAAGRAPLPAGEADAAPAVLRTSDARRTQLLVEPYPPSSMKTQVGQ
jgi:hypothetical protein